MLLFDFSTPRVIGEWASINDGVMGGVSTGRLGPTGAGAAAFSGVVSLEHRGGFASVRSRPGQYDLRRFSGLALRLRGDGRGYKANMKTEGAGDDILYRARFDTRADAWDTVRLAFNRFTPTFRGRLVPQAPPFDPARVTSFGLMISDGQAGPFRLEIETISAYIDHG